MSGSEVAGTGTASRGAWGSRAWSWLRGVSRGLAVAAVLFVLSAALFFVWALTRPSESSREVLTLYGNVDIRDVQLALNESDRVASMLVKEGDRVRAGQLLATLDTRRLKASLARAEAQAASQKQILARLVNGTRPEDIRKARAEVDLAAASLENARRTSVRREALAARNAASKQDADDARAAVAEDEARLASARAALDLAVAGPRVEDIEEARATLASLEAQLATARIELADASLYAPSEGVIQERLLEPGDMASAQRPVYTVALTDPVWVRAYVSEPDLGKITLGMKAEVETDSFPGKRYAGWVGFISPTAEFTPKSVEVRQLRTRLVYQVRVFVNNPRDELRLGMPATVSIALNQPKPADQPAAAKPTP
ncbi:MAG: efflux RND transporter periplasmic adaptor subunit [Planctomycetota bacterium]|nr:efflux RND transporter periplasmic adaptor subunit [Planctomycetota bacterium]